MEKKREVLEYKIVAKESFAKSLGTSIFPASSVAASFDIFQAELAELF